MERRTLYWDVDTQYDFMKPDGKLYVEGAEAIVPVVNQLRQTALESGCSIVASMDWHRPDNPEISDQPNFQTTFPPHCMAGTNGAERIGDLGELPIDVIDTEPLTPNELAEVVRQDQFHVEIHKETLEIFSNPNTAALLEAIPTRTDRIVVFGVALDFCIKTTIEPLTRFDVELILVRDATRAIDVKAGDEILADFERRGVHVTEFARLQELVPCG